MRAAPAVERRRPTPLRWWIIGLIVGALLIGLVFLHNLATFYVDFLWFDALGKGGAWRGLIGARLVPAAIFTTVFFAVMLGNLIIADRIAPKLRVGAPRDELVERYNELSRRFGGRIRVLLSAFFALVAGAQVSTKWKDWILFTHAQDFGAKDPQFNKDIGFYVFQLPFLQFIAEWAFASLAIVFIITLVVHYLNGGIRLQGPGQRVTPQVKAHLSVLLGVMALVKAIQYYFGKFALNGSTRGFVQGATYTDVNAQLPAFNLLLVIACVAAVLFLLNIWRKGWVLPIIAVGLWALVSVIVGAVYPWFVQEFRVQPDQSSKERPYIARNIEGTQKAFSLDQVQARPYDYKENLDQATVSANAPTLENVRLWDPAQLQEVYQKLQAFRSQDVFSAVDADRYKIDGRVVPVMTGGRDLNEDKLPSRTWVNTHLFYTSGYGSVVARANEVAADDKPAFLLDGIPPGGSLEAVKQPQIYFGEDLNGYVVVDSKHQEFEPVGTREGQEIKTSFQGDTGIELSSIWRRLAATARFSDINLLISDQVTPESQLLFNRDVATRVRKLAPFLEFDSNPYLTVVDGRQYWIVDAYTTSNQYPYSESYNPGTSAPEELASTSGLNTKFNYVRNSVKAVVDAYDGKVTFYVVDETDPIAKAYRQAFPELFTSVDRASDDLVAHFRYAEDLFRVQTTMYAQYHVTDPDEFFSRNSLWSVQQDPRLLRQPGDTSTPTTLAPTATTVPRGAGSDRLKVTSRRIAPIYQTMALPGDPRQQQQFVLTRPFVPFGRETQLASFMIARSDLTKEQWKSQQARLFTYDVVADTSSASGAPTPVRVTGDINTNTQLSAIFTLLGSGDSQVIPGEIQLVPIGDSILFFRPIYVKNANEPEAFPRFRYVIAAYGSNTAMQTSVDLAINALLFGGPQLVVNNGQVVQAGPGGTTPSTPSTTTAPPPGGTTTTTVPPADQAALLAQLRDAADEYQAAVSATPYDAGRIQKAADRMATLIHQLEALENPPASTAPPPANR